MRLLHTGDWHVGKSLRGRSRAAEHEAVLREIADLACDNRVDVVLIAGDLFDTAAPAPEAEKIVYQALLALAKTVAHVVVIAGNHDNPRRFEAVGPLLELTNIHCVPRVARPRDGGVLSLDIDGERVRIASLPFLSQRNIVRAGQLMSGDAADHALAYAERLAKIVHVLTDEFEADSVNVLLAHAMVHGGVMGGGERSAHTVFDYSVPTTSFPPSLHYVALGHLHRAQQLPAACPVWYAGSPLQLDFGETEDRKSVNLVDAEAGRPARVEQLPLSGGRRLRTVRGTLEQLTAMAGDLGEDYLRVDVEQPPAPGLAEQVRTALPNAVDVRIVHRHAGEEARARVARSGRPPQALFADYLAERGMADARVQALFAELLDETHAPA